MGKMQSFNECVYPYTITKEGNLRAVADGVRGNEAENTMLRLCVTL